MSNDSESRLEPGPEPEASEWQSEPSTAPQPTSERHEAEDLPQPHTEAQANAEHGAAPDSAASTPEGQLEPLQNFADILTEFERGHTRKPVGGGAKQIEGRVISVTTDQVFLDIGYKIEGVLPRSAFRNNAIEIKSGDTVPVSIKGRNEEGYYDLTRFQVAQPHDWTALEDAFKQKIAIVGTVTGVVKGGLTVDVGVRAFMPASRSGTHDPAELEQLVGTEITCRITKLDTADEDVVVDRRVVLEEQARAAQEGRLAVLQPGDVLDGTVRSLMPYGAFVDLGGFDGLLHVSDISWNRVDKPEDVLSVGQKIHVRVLKLDPETKRISLGLKQLQPEPWESVPAKYQTGGRVIGTVSRLTEFGAFIEIEPGIEGLVHISELSWGKKVRHPSDVVKQGDQVETVILSIKPEERRISLGLKQTLTDPWSDLTNRLAVGSQVEGPVTRLTPFGAFVQIAEGVEGLVHVSEISAEKRIHHPQDVLRIGQNVKAQVLGIAPEKRQIRLSIKQLVPTSIDEYIAEHKPGDVVSGRVVEAEAAGGSIELGEGIRATYHTEKSKEASAGTNTTGQQADLSALTSMLQARWKGSARMSSAVPEPLRVGQIRSFKITKIDAAAKIIEVQPA